MVWKYQFIKPVVTRSDGGDDSDLEPNNDGWFNIKGGPDDTIELSISGPSFGFRFYLNDVPATVTLSGEENPVAATWSGNNAFIQSDDDLTVILDADYVIRCPKYSKAIDCGGNIKLGTTGESQTLTVITNDDGDFAYGIYGDSNYDAWMYEDVSALAADGFTVSYTGPTSNGDGTYTWEYTVSPIYSFGGYQVSPGPLYYDEGYKIQSSWNHDSYNSIKGKANGSYYFNPSEMCDFFGKDTNNNIDNSNHPFADGWRLPTNAEWKIILGTSREGSSVNWYTAYKIHYSWVQLEGISYAGSDTPYGLLVFPDGKTITGKKLNSKDGESMSPTTLSIAELNNYLDQGCAFLPATGRATPSWVHGANAGYYFGSLKVQYGWESVSIGYGSSSNAGIGFTGAMGSNYYYTARLVRPVTNN